MPNIFSVIKTMDRSEKWSLNYGSFFLIKTYLFKIVVCFVLFTFLPNGKKGVMGVHCENKILEKDLALYPILRFWAYNIKIKI